jgi:hypothetical protein
MFSEQPAWLEFSTMPFARAHHLGDSKVIRETQWPAAQRGKAGAKNHSIIRVLGRSDDLFLEATRRLIDHQVNEPENEIVSAHLR